MKVGQVTQKIEVQRRWPPTVDLTTSTIGGVVGQDAVAQLPLNGRDWTSLATLQPGSRLGRINSSEYWWARPGSPGLRSANDHLRYAPHAKQLPHRRYQRERLHQWRSRQRGRLHIGCRCGAGVFRADQQLFSGIWTHLRRRGQRLDQIRDESVTTATSTNICAIARWTPGIILIRRQIPAFRRNQFGAALGGPIVKDRTFFFADYEGLRQNQGITSRLLFLRLRPAKGYSVQSRNPDPAVARRTRFLVLSTPIRRPESIRRSFPYLGLWGLPNAGLIGNGDSRHLFVYRAAHYLRKFRDGPARSQVFRSRTASFGSYQYDFATRYPA